MGTQSSEAGLAELDRQLQTFIGRSGAQVTAPDPVNASMIRHWCVALGDMNPAYLDSEAAAETLHGTPIAPPAMLQAWTMPDYGSRPQKPDAIDEIYALLDSHGFTSIVATNSEQDYLLPVRIGDSLRSVKTITAVSPPKKTALGDGYFITSTIEFSNQEGAVVGRQLHRVLKFKPVKGDTGSPEPTALRPRPNMTADTAFFFEGARQHRLLIQRCQACDALQHPPTAACATCGSLSLTPAEMSGRGTLYSYTIVHAPVVPPFEAPYPVILVELEEGPRIVSELAGVSREEIMIGMPLVVDFIDCDAELSLPVFRAAEA